MQKSYKSEKQQYLDKVSWANEQVNNNNVFELGYDYSFCVLNDIGCGELK